MMGNWGYGNMMGWSQGGWWFGSIFGIVLLVDLILLAIWLWKKIQEK